MEKNNFFNIFTAILLVVCLCGAGFGFIAGDVLAGVWALLAAGIDILASSYWFNGKKKEAELMALNMQQARALAAVKPQAPKKEEADSADAMGALKKKVKTLSNNLKK